MGFFSCTSKFILFYFNLLIVLLGLAVLGVGVYGVVSSGSFGGNLSTHSIIIIVLGVAVTLIAFFGCWGAIQENRCLLNTYGAIVLVLLSALVACGVVVLVNKSWSRNQVSEFMTKQYDKYLQGDTKWIDDLQSTAHCCGLEKGFWMVHNVPTPGSCCNNGQKTCTLAETYTDGCLDVVLASFDVVVKVLGIFIICVGGVEAIAVILAFFLAHTIRREELRSYT